MDLKNLIASVPVSLLLAASAFAGEPPAIVPVSHEELSRAIDELAGQIQGLGERWRGHFVGNLPPAERPLISIMLSHRQELGLSASQIQELERLRTAFQREAIKRDADQRVAEMDLTSLLHAEPVDMAKVEATVREIERARAELRLGRIRAIEQARAQLTPEQRAKLADLLGGAWPSRSRAGDPRPPHSPASPRKL
jgi:Spy/CpxP family protein refolding chaperone